MKRGMLAGRRLFGGPGFSVLNDDQVHEIHQATLEVLYQTGVRVEDPDSRELLASAGAGVDQSTGLVRIPSHMVEDAIRSCPPKLVFHGRKPEQTLVLEDDRIHFTSFGGALNIRDHRTGEVRPLMMADQADYCRVVDALDELDLIKPPGNAKDVDQELLQVHNARCFFTNTSKPIYMVGGNPFQLEKIRQMAALVAGGDEELRRKPNIAFSVCPTSPMKLTAGCCALVKKCAGDALPMSITSMVMAGASAPVTLAGAMVVHNAEVLAALTLHQLYGKGAPVIYGHVSTNMDLRFSMAPLGSPEMALLAAGAARMARLYSMPSNVGGGIDSKLSDAQAGHELTLTQMLPALAGANIVTGAGILDSGLTVSHAQLVMDAEFVRMTKQVVGGIPVNQDTLAMEVIHEIGPFKDFLTTKHTFNNMRTAHAQTAIIDRKRRENWEELGSKDAGERAAEAADRILETHQPLPLPDEVAAGLDTIVKQAEEELAEAKK